MKILFYDCFAGISGDMNLAAMIDLGVDPAHLRAELSKLGLDHEFELRAGEGEKSGIRGTRVDVILAGERDRGHDHDHSHHHEHGHHHHGHEHEHPHGHVHGHGHHHDHGHNRTMRNIAALIEASELSRAVKDTSLAIFRRLAEAEGRVHGKPADDVHFHEVGATDAIVDIVGAAICFHALAPDAVWSSPVELGGGFARCAHGLMPVPAPATAEILSGVPTTRGATHSEATTPTGAAILATLVDRFVEAPRLVMERTAYGIGHRDAEIPNVLRVQLARPIELDHGPKSGPGADIGTSASAGGFLGEARMLQCNIDDMTAEMLGVAMETLMEAGAMDVHFTPIIMKKNRPGTIVSLLCSPESEERFKDLLFRHTTTLGIKSFALQKTVLRTSVETLETPLGSVRMKNALLGGQVIRSKPELEDCREIAKRSGVPLSDVYAAVAKHKK